MTRPRGSARGAVCPEMTSATRLRRLQDYLWLISPCTLLVLLAACGGSQTAVATPRSGISLQVLQLRASDLPSGFVLATRTRLAPGSTARSQALEPSRYLAHGGAASLAERFVLRHPATVGLTAIVSQIFAFNTPGDARWGFHHLRLTLARSGTIGPVQQSMNVSATPTPLPAVIKKIQHPAHSVPTRYQAEKVPPVGDEDTGFTNVSDSYAGEYVFTNQVVLFRRGRYCALVHISGNYGQVPLRTAVELSRLIEARVRRSQGRD